MIASSEACDSPTAPEPYTAPSYRLLREVLARGETALGDARDLRAPDLAQVGARMLRMGRVQEAATAFRLALTSDSSSWAAHRGLADAYRRLGERALAVGHYRRAVESFRTTPTRPS